MNSSRFEPTGTVYTAQPTVNYPYRAFGGFLNVSNPEFSQGQTGQDVKVQSEEAQPSYVEYLPVENLLKNTTGYELPVNNILLTFFGVVADRFVTGYRVKISSSKDLLSETLHQVSSQEFPILVRKRPTPNPATRLREISGLDVGRLAYIFKVSRPTYHKWISNSIPHNTHREHLLEVLSLIEEVARRLGSPNNVADWLMTPVTSNGTKPIDYLRTGKFLTFRGFLLSIRTGNEIIQPLDSPTIVRSELPREEMEEEIENLSPRTLPADEINLDDLEL